MAPGSGPDEEVGRSERPAIDGAQLREFLRCSHIFSAALQEIIDVRQLAGNLDHHVTVSQLQLLTLITEGGPHKIGDVAALFGVSSPAATKSIDKLEALGLVARTPSTSDRRVTILTASDEGRRLAAAYEQLKRQRLQPILDEFSADEVDRLSQSLERFAVELFSQHLPRRGYCLRCGAYIDNNCPIGRLRGGCPYQRLRAMRPKEADTT
ncbi:MAG: MarR family transcriptional regulator [Acidobacteriota bacterium]|nr:MAG: MarR family transcriptional regulator [Acidobacteriota bacterium]